MNSKKPKRALVLSGGGARGAYEAGTLRYILQVLPDHLPEPPRFDIICGASVGAINAAWLAATIHEPRYSGNHIDHLWRSLVFSEVVKFSYGEVWRIFRRAVVEPKLPIPDGTLPTWKSREGGFLKTSFFDRFVREQIPFDNISTNLQNGYFSAISVTATDIITGRTTVFVQSDDPLPPWTRDARRIAVPGKITGQKVLGSAAIPLLFPSVKIGTHWYSDGGLRQNTPISPALRLGADRVMVIALKSSTFAEEITTLPESSHDSHPNQAFILGKILDALLLDPLDYDLSVLKRLNAILKYGEEAFGEDSFIDKLNTVVRAHRGQGYRYVHPLLIRPSKDLGELAAEFATEKSSHFWGSIPLRLLAERALDAEGARESDFLSFILFDGGYAGQLVDLGYEDARARHDELVEFFL